MGRAHPPAVTTPFEEQTLWPPVNGAPAPEKRGPTTIRLFVTVVGAVLLALVLTAAILGAVYVYQSKSSEISSLKSDKAGLTTQLEDVKQLQDQTSRDLATAKKDGAKLKKDLAKAKKDLKSARATATASYSSGYLDGNSSGYVAGSSDSYDDGYDYGYDVGYDNGYDAGYYYCQAVEC